MKKFFLSFVLVCLVAVFGVSAVGCGLNVKNDVVNNLSDVRYSIFAGQTDGVVANIMFGMRENPYAYDGVSRKKTEFGVLAVNLVEKPTQPLRYSLTAGKSNFSGTLEENPYNHSYMIDIEKIITEDVGIYLTVDGVVENLQLVPISKTWAVDYGKALDLAIEMFDEEIKGLYQSRKFCAECYLKIVCDQANVNKPYFWCFMFVGQDGQKGTAMIDVETGEVLTQKTSGA